MITVVLIIRLALPLFCQINPIQITIIISESKKSPNETLKQWWNVHRKPSWIFQFPNFKDFVNLQLNLSNTCSSLKYLFPTSSNTVSIVFCSVKSFFDHHDCIFEEYRERGVSTGCFIVKLIIKMDRYVFKAVESNKDQCFSQFGFYYI